MDWKKNSIMYLRINSFCYVGRQWGYSDNEAEHNPRLCFLVAHLNCLNQAVA